MSGFGKGFTGMIGFEWDGRIPPTFLGGGVFEKDPEIDVHILKKHTKKAKGA